MAHTLTHSTFSGAVVRGVTNTLSSFWDGLIAVAEANSQVKKIQDLHSLSDEALAAKGIRRDQIVQHVFRDRLYL
ncbi:MAG: DUF1127 domain-containing protein [Marinosulfonomonas sp.]|nr:DUF1127 domain-containing protein [Marinosulfonomonas sp.]